jgi:hypothetical protein
MDELTPEQKQVIEAYLSKEVALTQAQKKALEDYLSNRSDLSRAEKMRINSYLRTVIFSVLGVLGITTLIAFTTLWDRMIVNVKKEAITEVVSQANQDLEDNNITQKDLEMKASNLDGQFSFLTANIADIQGNVFTLQTSDLNQLGQSIEEFMATLGDKNAEGKTALDIVTGLETRIKALETSLDGLSVIVVQDTTDENGNFSIKHGVTNSSSIVGATFAIKNKNEDNWYSQTPDDVNPEYYRSNWLYWNDVNILGGILDTQWGKQPVRVTIFLKSEFSD